MLKFFVDLWPVGIACLSCALGFINFAVTAEYFIFMAMKKLQLNPEVSSVYFRTPLDEDQQMSLYRYFMNVEHII